jgi:hypothetical protein
MIALIALCSGCAGYGTITRNLAEDGAIVVAKIGTPWGVQEITRVGTTTNTVLIEPGGRVVINPQSLNAAREGLLTSSPTSQPRQVAIPLKAIEEAFARKKLEEANVVPPFPDKPPEARREPRTTTIEPEKK